MDEGKGCKSFHFMMNLYGSVIRKSLVADTQLREALTIQQSVGPLVHQSISISKIVAKALDGQQYPLPLREYMWV